MSHADGVVTGALVKNEQHAVTNHSFILHLVPGKLLGDDIYNKTHVVKSHTMSIQRSRLEMFETYLEVQRF